MLISRPECLMRAKTLMLSAMMFGLAACGTTAQLTVAEGSGLDPELPPPHSSLIPTVHIATAIGWPDGGKPLAAKGLSVAAFARPPEPPRWLPALPHGGVLEHGKAVWRERG